MATRPRSGFVRAFCAVVVGSTLAIGPLGVAIAMGASGGSHYDGVIGWGDNSHGQTDVPADLSGVIAISAADYYSLALKSDGTVVEWGAKGTASMTPPADLRNVVAISACSDYALALKRDGTVTEWGPSGKSQAQVPVNLNDVVAIAAGAEFGMALQGDGMVVAWGYDTNGSLAVPADLLSVTAISARGALALALKSDGTIQAWGDNSAHQAEVPAGVKGVKAIAAGGSFGLALKTDGTVVAWGDDDAGERDVPAGLSGVTAISAGKTFGLALEADGTIVEWGSKANNQTKVPAGIGDVTSISGGDGFVLAITTAGAAAPVVKTSSSFFPVPGLLVVGAVLVLVVLAVGVLMTVRRRRRKIAIQSMTDLTAVAPPYAAAPIVVAPIVGAPPYVAGPFAGVPNDPAVATATGQVPAPAAVGSSQVEAASPAPAEVSAPIAFVPFATPGTPVSAPVFMIAGAPSSTASPVAKSGRRLRVRGAHLSRRVKLVMGIGLVAVLVAASVPFVVLREPSAGEMTSGLIMRMAARDSSVSKWMDSDDAFRSIAAQMGVIGVPGSVKMSVYNVEATETKAQSGDITVNATYTLQWSGNNGSSGWVTQSLTAAYTKSGGRGHLTKVAISPTLQFDEYAYFGESGTSEADANKVAADLKAGSSWIPGIDVKVSSWKQDTKTTPTITAVPGHLTKWVKTVTPAVNGSKTTWDVEVAGSKVSYSWISAASSVTAKPTGAQIQQGTITDAEAVAGAAAVQKSLAAAARSGDLTTFNSLVTGPKVDAAGLAHMNTWAFGSGTGTATEGSSGPEVSVSGDHGTLTYVLGSDGKWTIDSTRSSLAEAWRPGDGTVYRYEAGVCFGSECEDLANFCVSHVGVSLTGVTYYTNATAEAAFHFTSTNPECALGDLISTVVVSWPGGSDTIHPQVAGTNDSSSNDAVVPLPSGVTADKHPVQLEITGWNYYDPMDDPMYFSTI